MVVRALDVVAIVVAVIILGVAALVARRLLIQRGGATVDCSARQGRGRWALGVGRYRADRLEWFRFFSFSPSPRWTLPRGALTIQGRRALRPGETHNLPSGAIVVECRVSGEPSEPVVELAMGRSALTGFQAWLEAAPPGAHLQRD